MTSLSQLKKDVETLRHALSVDVPEWKERSDGISMLLRKFEELGLTGKEQEALAKEVANDLHEKGVI